MHVLKFGGSSMGSSQSLKQVIQIILTSHQKYNSRYFIVSALGGTTDQLIEMAKLASQRESKKWQEIFTKIQIRHFKIIQDLIEDVDYQSQVKTELSKFFDSLKTELKTIETKEEIDLEQMDEVMSFGERLSAFLLSQILKLEIKNSGHNLEVGFLNAKKIIKTDSSFGKAEVNFEETFDQINQHATSQKGIWIVTGFIGSDTENRTTTLGRGGSDYTVAIIGASLNADEIQIWTDVNGVMTADPRKVSDAKTLKGVSYREALELSHFGAKVIYPPTILPALKKQIPIRIKNTFNPEHPGTIISEETFDNGSKIKAVSTIKDLCILSIQGSGLTNSSLYTSRLFSTLAKKNIHPIVISQASSQYSITFGVKTQNRMRAILALEEEFLQERKQGFVEKITSECDMAVISIIGENMSNQVGVSSDFFTALKKTDVNVRAIAQGSSELNVTAVIAKDAINRAVLSVHRQFFRPQNSKVKVFLVGTGLIGTEFVKQALNLPQKIDIVGLINSRQMMISLSGLNLVDLEGVKNGKAGQTADLEKFVSQIQELNLEQTVLVDCTSSLEAGNVYKKIIKNKQAVVTANKKFASHKQADFDWILDQTQSHFAFEANVGAGLPVIQTLQSLIATGDEVKMIQGVFSGTLSYLFNTWDGKSSFAKAVTKAKELGFTEPDPREDLNGLDVARKLLILARLAGFRGELSDVKVESLIPQNCLEVKSVDEFMTKLHKSDSYFAKLAQTANKKQQKLRYLASFDGQTLSAKLTPVDSNHPTYHLNGSDNLIAVWTKNYSQTPLVIQGPGAGDKVTAAGILADVLRLGFI